MKALLIETTKDSLKGELYFQIGVLTDEKEQALSIEYLEKALDYFTRADAQKGMARTLNSIGYNYWIMGRYGEATDYYNEALNIFRRLDDKSSIARVCNNLGAVYWGLSIYNKALELYQEALDIRRRLGDQSGVAVILNNIGLVYQEWKLHDQALQYHRQAVEIAEEINDREVMAYSYHNMGLCFEAREEYKEALNYFSTAYEEYRAVGKIGGATSLALRSMGDVYNKRGNYEDALYYYRKALEDARFEGNIFRETYAQYSLAKTFVELSNQDSAQYYLNLSFENARTYEYDKLLRDIYYLFSTIHENRKNHENALKYYKMASALNDSIFNEEKSSRFTELQIQYSLEKKRQENEVLKMDNEIQRLRIRRDRIVRHSLLAGSFFILMAVIVLFRQRQHLKRTNEEKEQEIHERKAAERQIKALLEEKEILLKEVHHRIKNNLNTVRSLLTLQARSLQDNSAKAALNDAGNRVQSMSLLYDKLYRSENVQSLSTREYFNAIVDEIVHVFPNRDQVRVHTDIEDFKLSVKTLSTLGIIVTELITNAMKYGFPEDRKGIIQVDLSRKQSDIIFVLSNDGVGLPRDFSPNQTKGFGLHLVSMLIQQLNGKLEIHSNNETKFTIIFPMP